MRSPSSAIAVARPAPARVENERERATVGHEADVDERQQHVGRLGADEQVAGQRERAADADRGAVERRDDRLGHPPQRGEDRVVDGRQRRVDVDVALGRQRARGQVAQIGSGGERAAVAGHADGAHAIVVGDAAHGFEQLEPELVVPSVQRLRAIEADDRARAATLELESLVHAKKLP